MLRAVLCLQLAFASVVLVACGGGKPPAPGGGSDKADEPRVTLKNYNAALTGMDYEQVRKVIGFGAEETSRSEFRGVVTVHVVWRNPDGSSMSGTFRDGVLTAKSQHGLK